MKKLLAVMLATATVMSVGVTAFADDVNEPNLQEGSSSASSSETSSTGSSSTDSSSTGSSSTVSSDVSSIGSSSAGSSSNGSSSEEAGKPAMDKATGIQISVDTDGVNLKNDILEPGTEYKFPVSMTIDGKDTKITSQMMDGYKFNYSRISTKGMKRFEIDEHKDQYYLYVEANNTTSTKPVDIKYNVKLTQKSNNHSIFSQEVKFQYGYDEMEGDYITGLDKGDNVEIDNSRPVITTTQFEKIAKINEYKNVTLSGSGWEFNVNLTGETTKNLVHNNAGVKDILAKFPDQDFKFYNFPGKPTFSATGRLSLDVEDIVDDFDKMYTYRYADGKLYRMSATFAGDDNTLTFRTNRMDTFVVTDKLIKDGTVVNEVNNNNSSNGNSEDEGKDNPTTGANDLLNVAVMAAIAALGTAGAITVKKFSK